MRVRSAALIVIVAITAASGAVAQQTRDVARAPNAVSGSAVISGVLMTDTAAPEPVRRAAVRLTGAVGTGVRITGTDDEGRFVFAALPGGSFSLSATKAGYVPAFHGSKQSGRGLGVPIVIAEGQRVAITMKILPGAVITGTITDFNGRPAPSVPVQVVQLRSADATSVSPIRVMTDDRGVYRSFGLPPGDYLVSALPAWPRFGTGIRAPGQEVLGVTDAEVLWARGSGAPMPPPGRPVSYAPIYFPGTTDAGAAMKVSVAAGEERASVGFPVWIVTPATIAGRLIDHNGQPIISTTSVFLYPRRNDQDAAVDVLVASGALVLPRALVITPTFSIAAVAPGDYVLQARTGSAEQTLWNITDLTVDGRDQTDLVLQLEPGMTISGSVLFDRSLPAPPSDMGRIDLTLASTLAGVPTALRAAVKPDGTFQFTGVVPGTYTLNAVPPLAGVGARWRLQSATLNGRALGNAALEVKRGQDITGLVLTFSDR